MAAIVHTRAWAERPSTGIITRSQAEAVTAEMRAAIEQILQADEPSF